MNTTQHIGQRIGSFGNAPNEVLKPTSDEKFYVSYCPNTTGPGDPSTALVVGERLNFLVLIGDHREQYKAAKTLEKCIEYFHANQSLKHEVSEYLGQVFTYPK